MTTKLCFIHKIDEEKNAWAWFSKLVQRKNSTKVSQNDCGYYHPTMHLCNVNRCMCSHNKSLYCVYEQVCTYTWDNELPHLICFYHISIDYSKLSLLEYIYYTSCPNNLSIKKIHRDTQLYSEQVYKPEL